MTQPNGPAPDSQPTPAAVERLEKKLGLLDVFAISTGAMFSSGFFLLPGVAAGTTGPSVFLAYLLASFLILPAMFSMAELSTAMPRAGGAYYFLDRALGPMAGTIGGLGTWLALVLKSAFALIGMGAYLVLFFELPIVPVAVALTVVFGMLNIFGAKETAGLQRALVLALVGIMTFYIVQGMFEIFDIGIGTIHATQMQPFFAFGAGGFFATVGTVFVSYAGLTKVASVSEEIRDPDRNIPLGMLLSLFVTTIVYVLGVYLMVAVLPPADLRADLTPVATAGEAFLDWLPQPIGLILVVVAAVAAFASTGNAGILAASRYPLAMARDNLIPARFRQIGSRSTPTFSILVTAGLMILAIVFLDVEQVAKLASAFQLLIFALLNVALIVMRESRITTYLPGYMTPLYPWMQIFGAVTSLLLVAQIGLLSALFTIGLVGIAIAWYFAYGRSRAHREGAIYHLFARLGERRFEGLDFELREIMKERKAFEHDRFEEIVAASYVLDIHEDVTYEEAVRRAAAEFAQHLPYSAEELEGRFLDGVHISGTPVSHGAALPDLRLPDLDEPCMVLVRLAHPIYVRRPEDLPEGQEPDRPVCALIFLVSPASRAGQHLRVLAELVSRVDEDSFLRQWNHADDPAELREVLLRHERYITLDLERERPTAGWIGKSIREVHADHPESTLIALVRRNGDPIIPHGATILEEHDRITVIGTPVDIREMYERYG